MPEINEYICESSGYALDDLFGMPYEKAVLGSCIPDEELDEIMGLKGPKGILLTGPVGSGKETLSVGLAGSLVSCGYVYYRVPGSHLVRYPQLCGQLGETILSMEQNAGTAGVYLYLDDVSPLNEEPEVSEYLVNILRGLLVQAKHLVIVATALSKKDVPSGLGKYLMECKVLPPTVVECRMLLEQSFSQRIFLEKGLGFHTLAEMCEGFTYGQMKEVINLSLLLLKDKAHAWYGKNRENMLEAWKSGRVVLTEEMFKSVEARLRKTITTSVAVPLTEQKEKEQTEQKPSEQKTEEPVKEFDFMDIVNMNVDNA